ncbi:MAG: amino acid adenylation domain protein, partial [Bacteroidetes bacterium]|nr:amino acid adenylation domain protein [Bacteroidota bacterium]
MVEDVYPLSPLQEGFYYHWLEAPGASAYFNQISCRVNGALEINKIEESYRILSARHAVLRTFFTSEYSDNTLQVVIKDCPPAFTYKEIPGEVESSVEEYKYTDRKKGFNLHNGSQIRLTLLGLGENAYEFIWSHHHILMDGWCIGILINEFFQIYHSLVRGATIKQETVRPYSDYIKWLMKKEKSGSLRYWKEYLSGFNTLTPLPKRPVKEEGIAHHPGETSVSLDPSVRAAMKRLCSTLGITDYIFIQTAWAVLLSRYNNTGDVVFGSVVSGRPGEIDGIERMVGLFINTIPVRVKINSGVTIRQLLKEVQQRSIEESEHHYTQLADIQSQSEIKQSLFDHILQFQNFPVEEMIQQSISDKGTAGELSFLSSDTFEQNNYDFTCMVIPSAALTLKFSYNSCMYEASQVKQMESHFLRVITQMALSPESAIGQIDYLSEEEKLELEGFNDTKVNYPTEKTIINLFEEQVKKYPENIAVTAGTTALTYRELNERSNQLASYLRKEYKIKPDDLIGIKVERSEVMIIAILGVLKSGGAYVPIDPEYPQERIEYMIADSCCKVVLDAGELKKFEERSGSYEKENPTPVNKPHDLAYVIYTSGTTGKPKGSLIEHKNVVRLFKTGKPLFDFNEKDVWTMFHSY